MGAGAMNVPPPPAGFILETEAPSGAIPPPPDGFELVPDSGIQTPSPVPEAGGVRDAMNAFAGSAIEGVPIAGPYLKAGVDRLKAGVQSIANDTRFSDELQQVEDRSQRTTQQYPWTSTAGAITGGILGTAPAVVAAPQAFGVGAGSLAARSAASALSGGAIGAADSAVRSEGDMGQIAGGGIVGGLLGGAAPGAGALVGRAVGAIAGRGQSGAERALGQAMGREGIDPATAQGRLSAMGDAAMPMDLGPNFQQQGGALAATPGRAQAVVRDALAQRQAGAAGRVTQEADQALGSPIDLTSSLDDLIAKRSAAATPLYDEAYSTPFKATAAVGNILKTPAGSQALREAQRLAQNEGIPIDPSALDVRGIDLVQRALSDQISTAQRAGKANAARTLVSMRERLLKDVDAAVPKFAEARNAFAGPSQLIDAMEGGTTVFSRNVTPGQLRKQMATMSQSEQEAFTQGARSALSDVMGTARNDALAARRMLEQGYNREKLEILVGKQSADSLINRIQTEGSFASTNDVVTRNSLTASRQAGMQEVAPGALGDDPGAIRSILNLKAGDAAASIGGRVVGGARNAAREARNEDLARILTEVGPDRTRFNEAVAAIGRAAQRRDISSQQAQSLINSMRGGANRYVEQNYLRD